MPPFTPFTAIKHDNTAADSNCAKSSRLPEVRVQESIKPGGAESTLAMSEPVGHRITDIPTDSEKITRDPSLAREEVVRKHLVKQAVETCVPNALMGIDVGHLHRQAQRWNEVFPRVQPFYAVKSLPDETVVSQLAAAGCNFDCASKFEIEMVRELGIAPERIIYANPVKFDGDIEYAKAQGVAKMTFDNDDELEKIARIYPQAECVLRIVTDDSAALCQLSNKYGAALDDCPFLIERVRELGLALIGVSFHVGSGISNGDGYLDALTNARKVFDMALEAGLPPLRLLDIGGGMPGDDTGAVTMEGLGAVINPALDKLFPDQAVKVISEPGRFFSHGTGTLVTKVIGRRLVRNRVGDDPDVLYYVADGVYGSFNCMLYDHYTPELPTPVTAAGEVVTSEHAKTRVFGPTCDGLDMLYNSIEFPRCDVGDYFVFSNMGAYTIAAASRFNGVEKPQTTYIRTSE